MQALNAALVQVLVVSGQIHAPEGWGITSPPPGWTPSPSHLRNCLPGGQAAPKFRTFPVKRRVSELGVKMKETGLLLPKIVVKLHEWKGSPPQLEAAVTELEGAMFLQPCTELDGLPQLGHFL